MAANKGVLVLYTGGTIGCVPSDPNDPGSPMVAAGWNVFSNEVSALKRMMGEFRIEHYSFDPPIDSTNMQPKFWIEMAEVIERNYDRYEGFVILHGTDTMVYTASALSFMLQNLGKPVVITGSQLPIIGRLRNDGEQNLITALMIANPKYSGIPTVPEVCIFFKDKLIRGNRAVKISASGYSGFESPNYPALGEVGEHIKIHTGLVLKHPERAFVVKKRLDTNVIIFPIFPGIQSVDNNLISNVLHLEDLSAVVLLTYGTGNAPTAEAFLNEIEVATQKGIVVLNVSQCMEGTVELGVYDTSVALLDRGVASGSDITSEAALCKLMVLLGDEDISTGEVNKLVQMNMVGEQSRSIYTLQYAKKAVALSPSAIRCRIPGENIPGGWGKNNVEMVLLRLRSAEVKTDDPGKPLRIRVYINISSDDSLDESKPNYAGSYRRHKSKITSTLSFDVTRAARELLSPGDKVSFTLIIDDDEKGQLTWKQAEFVLYSKE